MNIKPKEILISVPIALMFDSEDEAAKFASNINSIIHGKIKLKYDYLGRLGDKEAIIFYLKRNDEYHSVRNEFIRLIEKNEMPSLGTEIRIDENIDTNLEKENLLFLNKRQMNKLTTESLLEYKKTLYKCPEEPIWLDDYSQMYKSHPEWEEAYKNVKEILASREHVEK